MESLVPRKEINFLALLSGGITFQNEDIGVMQIIEDQNKQKGGKRFLPLISFINSFPLFYGVYEAVQSFRKTDSLIF